MLKKKSSELAEMTYASAGWALTKGLSQSLITTFFQCPQKFMFKTNCWSSVKTKSSTSFGTLVHNVLELLYKGDKREITDLIDDAMKTYSGTDAELEATKAQAILDSYIEVYKDDFTMMNFQRVEGTFKLEVLGILLRGRIDGVYVDPHGGYWVIEHKTKSRMNEDDMMLRLSFDFQNLFYVFVIERLMGKKFAGVVYNVIRNPQHKQASKETLPDYFHRVADEVRGNPEHFFKRYEIPYTAQSKREFEKELNMKLEVITNHVSKNICYKNQNSCDFPYRCEFLNACATGNMSGYTQIGDYFPELVEAK